MILMVLSYALFAFCWRSACTLHLGIPTSLHIFFLLTTKFFCLPIYTQFCICTDIEYFEVRTIVQLEYKQCACEIKISVQYSHRLYNAYNNCRLEIIPKSVYPFRKHILVHAVCVWYGCQWEFYNVIGWITIILTWK